MKILSVVKQLARQINSSGQLIHVEHRPEPGAEFGVCFRNVGGKIERNGGTNQFGWMFVAAGKGFVVAVHHCVWCDSSGRLVDITPFDHMLKSVTADGKVVFLPDDAATPIKAPGCEYGLARANRVHVYSNNADTALVSKLIQQEREWEEELAPLQGIERAVTAAEGDRIVRVAAERGGCGGCRACCIAMGVKELDKPTWGPCEYLSTTGCAIYRDRPQSCKGFYCSFLMGDTPADPKYRPDNLGILICLEWGQTCIGLRAPIVVCYELHPGAFSAHPWVKQLADQIAHKYHCRNVWWYPHKQDFCKWEDIPAE
jgi:hypothetical protein